MTCLTHRLEDARLRFNAGAYANFKHLAVNASQFFNFAQSCPQRILTSLSFNVSQIENLGNNWAELTDEERDQRQYVIDKFEELKSAYSLHDLRIVYQENSHSTWAESKVIGFGRSLLREDRQCIDFFLAHEFAHVLCDHSQAVQRFYQILGKVELIALLVFFPSILMIELAAYLIGRAFFHRIELKADQIAAQILGSYESAKYALSKLLEQSAEGVLETIGAHHVGERQKKLLLELALDYSGQSHPSLVKRARQFLIAS